MVFMRALMVVVLLSLPLSSAARAEFPAARLPASGSGYTTPSTWAERGLRWGRPELVGLIQRAAKRVTGRFKGSLLYVADLSTKRGQATQWHKTHRGGVDVDLIFYALDEKGKPMPAPSQMVVYGRDGKGVMADGRKVQFDTRRNWALVKALLLDPRTQVTRIFVCDALRRRLLEHGVRVGDEPELLARAGELMVQPGDSLPHDDHFHVRIVPGTLRTAWTPRRGGTPPPSGAYAR